jgi:uncharacterized protein involved in exopolysaccharide biosynthesis/Mrp family chromosome partitioning ATPase
VSPNLPATIPSPSYDTIDGRQILQILRRRAGMIAAITAGATICALLQVLFATPQFTVHGTLYLGDTQSGGDQTSGAGLNIMADYSGANDVETQIEQVTAGALVENAVLATGLNAQITPADAPPLTYWRWKFYDGGRMSSFLPGPNTLQALYATTPGNYRLLIGQHNNYELYTEATFLRSGRPLLQGEFGKPASGNGVSMLIQPANSNFQPTPGKAYDLKITSSAELADMLEASALSVIAGGTAVQPTKNAFLEFRWNNPYQAQLFVNRVMQDYIATQLFLKTQSASTTEDFVSDQLKNVRQSLAKADQDLADYQSKTGIIDVPQNAQSVITQLTQYQQQRATLQLQRQSLQQLSDELKTAHGAFDPYLISQTNDTVLTNLTDSLSNEELNLSTMQAQYTDAVHDVKVEQTKVWEIKRAIRETINNDLTAADQNLSNLNQQISLLQRQIKVMPAEALTVISLQRSADVLGQLYILLMQKQEEARLSKAATIISTRIVTPAHMPLAATSPKALVTVLFGALIGLAVSVAMAFGQRAFSGRFESEEQIRLTVRLPVYAAIPRRARKDVSSGIFDAIGYGPFSESFRLLRTSIYRATEAGKPMVILIISATKADGKTTIAANLAKSIADNGRKVVLVDGDLHLSRLRGLQPAATAGLTDWIMSGVRPDIQKWKDENFWIVGAGTLRFPGREKLGEDSLLAIFSSLRAEFEYVIIDSPPLPTVSDGMTLGIFADLILSVVSVSHTQRRSFSVHNELIDTLDRPHGIIINEVDPEFYGGSDAYFAPDTVRQRKFAGWFRMGQE